MKGELGRDSSLIRRCSGAGTSVLRVPVFTTPRWAGGLAGCKVASVTRLFAPSETYDVFHPFFSSHPPCCAASHHRHGVGALFDIAVCPVVPKARCPPLLFFFWSGSHLPCSSPSRLSPSNLFVGQSDCKIAILRCGQCPPYSQLQLDLKQQGRTVSVNQASPLLIAMLAPPIRCRVFCQASCRALIRVLAILVDLGHVGGFCPPLSIQLDSLPLVQTDGLGACMARE